MAGFDYDVVVIGSGFGGSVAAFRAAEKGLPGGGMESGKRWNDQDTPKTNWHDGRLHSRPGSGTAPSVHIPVVEEFADRLAKKMGTRQEALAFEVLNRTASAHSIGGNPDRQTPADPARSIPTSGCSASLACT
jgi:choline dehydrogenase-like flavoprotein